MAARGGWRATTWTLLTCHDLVGLALPFSSATNSATAAQDSRATAAQDNAAYWRQVRAIDTAELGVAHPAGLAFSPVANAFLVLEAQRAGQPGDLGSNIVMITLIEDPAGSVNVATAIADPLNVAFDSKAKGVQWQLSTEGRLAERQLDLDTDQLAHHQRRAARHRAGLAGGDGSRRE